MQAITLFSAYVEVILKQTTKIIPCQTEWQGIHPHPTTESTHHGKNNHHYTRSSAHNQ